MVQPGPDVSDAQTDEAARRRPGARIELDGARAALDEHRSILAVRTQKTDRELGTDLLACRRGEREPGVGRFDRIDEVGVDVALVDDDPRIGLDRRGDVRCGAPVDVERAI